MTDANIELELNRPYLPPIGNSQQIIGRVEVEPGVQTASVERHIAIVVDTSGSMSGEKMERLRDGAKYVLGYLNDDDIVTLVEFNSSATVVLKATRYGDVGREMVAEKIDELAAGGGTDIYGGLNRAADELGKLPEAENTARRILLLSDGKDNKREPEDFSRQAGEIDQQGIRIRAGGLGDDYEEETIRTLGTEARGQWSHIEEGPEISEFFGEAIREASTVVGSDAELRMNIADGIEFTEVYRAKPQTQQVDVEYAGGNEGVVKLPDLKEREVQEVLMKIQVPGSTTPGKQTLATFTLMAGDNVAEDRLVIEYTEDNDKLSVENDDVAIGLDETRVRTRLGEGNTKDAETIVQKMEEKHGETAEVEQLEEDVTRVQKGGRAEQDEATKVGDDDRF